MTPGETVSFWVCAILGMCGAYCASLLLLGATVGWLRARQAKRDMERKVNQYKLSRKPLVLLAVSCLWCPAATADAPKVQLPKVKSAAGKYDYGGWIALLSPDGTFELRMTREQSEDAPWLPSVVFRGKWKEEADGTIDVRGSWTLGGKRAWWFRRDGRKLEPLPEHEG